MKNQQAKFVRYLSESLEKLVTALVMTFLVGTAVPAVAQQGYEQAPVLSASKILPPELLSGPNHQVQERVTSDGYLNIYQIDSKFGTFTVVSTALLRKRIGEINAMVVMEKIQESKEYIDSIKEAGLDAMTRRHESGHQPSEDIDGSGRGFRRCFFQGWRYPVWCRAQPIRGGSHQRRHRIRGYETPVCVSVRCGCLFG